MLSVSKYSPEYVHQARASIDADVSAFAALPGERGARGVRAHFFNNMVLVLDHFFLHRGRNLEGKDGNPLNEARVLCNSMTDNDGVMAADKTVRMKPDKTLLKYDVGDEIALSEADFRRLAEGFFAEIESRYA